jgi:hypothetical protein
MIDGIGRPKELEDPVTMTVFVEREMRDAIPMGERSRVVRDALEAHAMKRRDWKKSMRTKGAVND